ncbi:hypothetical protein GLYMA_11G007750v4 [Glycine max]|nr:hypothetical protein GLYMA_11G007750v4 [Glycine max]KAH1156936.1 hypothetical protein GYH30_029646 [Glycine max]
MHQAHTHLNLTCLHLFIFNYNEVSCLSGCVQQVLDLHQTESNFDTLVQ